MMYLLPFWALKVALTLQSMGGQIKNKSLLRQWLNNYKQPGF